MFHFRSAVLGTVAVVAMGGAAIAADVPLKGPIYKAAPVSIWEGAYIGVHLGYGWATNDISAAGFGPDEVKSNGVIGGLQVGYNRHIAPNWILGFEADVSFGDLTGTNVIGGVIPTTSEISTFGTARTRLGYVNGRWMVYATGGMAWAQTQVTSVAFDADRPQIGYAIGGGVEYALARNWSAKFEYLYMDLGKTNISLAPAPSTDLTASVVRVGLNYRFSDLRTAALGYNAPTGAAFPRRYARSMSNWDGPYIGVHAGRGWGTSDDDFLGIVVVTQEPKGSLFGIQSGYNWQFAPHWVVGLETDTSWASLKASNAFLGGTIDIDKMGTVRTRLGYANSSWLMYVTGGLAWVHEDSTTFGGAVTRDRFHLGWVAGVGVEWAFSPLWSAKLEYLYADYGTIGEGPAIAFTQNLTTETVKLGLNYRASVLDLVGMRW